MIAVGACTAVDIVSILEKKRQKVTDYRVEVTGERHAEHPRYFEKFFVKHIITGINVDAKAVERAIELSDEKYCSVAATVKPRLVPAPIAKLPRPVILEARDLMKRYSIDDGAVEAQLVGEG